MSAMKAIFTEAMNAVRDDGRNLGMDQEYDEAADLATRVIALGMDLDQSINYIREGGTA
jgi:hypothetical protein